MPQVRIENPVPGGRPEMTLSKARSAVHRGRAIFVEPLVIRFIDSTHSKLAATAAASIEQRLHARVTGWQYDAVPENFHRCAGTSR